MKRVSNIYDQIYDFNNIINTYKNIKHNVRNKEKIIKFEEFYTYNIINIYNTLKEKNTFLANTTFFLSKNQNIES